MVLDFDGASCHQCKQMAKRGAKAKYMQKVIGVVVGASGWALAGVADCGRSVATTARNILLGRSRLRSERSDDRPLDRFVWICRVVGVVVRANGWVSTTFQRFFNGFLTALQ